MYRNLFILSFLFFIPLFAFAANPIFDAISSRAGCQSPTTACSWTHTATTTAEVVLLVGAHWGKSSADNPPASSGVGVSSITYNGVGLTRLASTSQIVGGPILGVYTSAFSELWYLITTSTGANTITANVSHNDTSSQDVWMFSSASFAQVNTTSSIPTYVTSSVADSALTTNITTAIKNSILVDFTVTDNRSNGDLDPGAGETEQDEQTFATFKHYAISTKTTDAAGAYSMFYSNNNPNGPVLVSLVAEVAGVQSQDSISSFAGRRRVIVVNW